MKSINVFYLLALAILLVFSSCKNGESEESPSPSEESATTKDATLSSGEGDTASTEDSGGSDGGNGNGQAQSGLITAAEWNDLSQWDEWNTILNKDEFSVMPSYWSYFTNNRISVKVENTSTPVINAQVELFRNDQLVWATKTDNFGMAELWVSVFQKSDNIDLASYSLKVNGEAQKQELTTIANGINTVNINTSNASSNRVEISFIVDATGSMSDELEFLKQDLNSVINEVKKDDSNLNIFTSTVFYRDKGDDYITKKSDFTSDLNSTINFIKQQIAAGGGDFPEAVHSALDVAINELQWSEKAKTKIAFLLLDAPPHYETNVTQSIQNTIKKAARMGVKIIPITASGIDKKTEFLMRFMAILTNGTYVFITNDSGIGGNHIEPSVGEYQVEILNQLMIRLIKKYSK